LSAPGQQQVDARSGPQIDYDVSFLNTAERERIAAPEGVFDGVSGQ